MSEEKDSLSGLTGVSRKLIAEMGGLTPGEEEHLHNAHTGKDSQYKKVEVLTAFYVTKKREKMTRDLIASNKKLATANEKHARSLNLATWALVGVTVVLAVIALSSSPWFIPWIMTLADNISQWINWVLSG